MSTESKHTWKVGLASDAIVDTAPCREGMSKDSFAWYGGNLICESVDPRHRSLILAAPALLEACIEAESTIEMLMGDKLNPSASISLSKIKNVIKQAKP